MAATVANLEYKIKQHEKESEQKRAAMKKKKSALEEIADAS